MISIEKYSYHSLLSLHRPGGESLLLSQDSTDPRRPLIYVEDLLSNPFEESKYSGRVVGIVSSGDTRSVEEGCFSDDCSSGIGIWSSYLTDTQTVERPMFEEGCFSEDCFGLYNPICKERLAYDYTGPHQVDSLGKYRLVDVDEAYCNENPNIPGPIDIPTDPYTVELHIEGNRVFNRYSYNSLSILIEQSNPMCGDCTSPKYYAYLDYRCIECLDPCIVSSLTYIGSFNSDLNSIESVFDSSDNLYNDINIIGDSYISNDSTRTSFLYQGIRTALDNLDLELDTLEYLTYQLLDLNKQLIENCQAPSQSLIPCTPPRRDNISNCRELCVSGYVSTRDNVYESRTVNGLTTIWVEGLLDESSGVFVVDIGYLHTLTFQPIFIDIGVPVRQGGIFYSRKELPNRTLKIIRVRRVDVSSSNILCHHITGYEPLTRTNSSSLLLYNYKDQLVDLEDLSISLINVLLSGYKDEDPCTKFYKNIYLDPELVNLVQTNIERLVGLIDLDPISKRYGSIPSRVGTYSTYNSIYDDSDYLNRTIRPFEEGLFNEECFQAWTNNTLIDRSVSNRALGWFLYLLCIYTDVMQDKRYIERAYLVARYLIRETREIRLVRDGYSHSDRYLESQAIDSYSSSTSVIVLLALLRFHDLTLDTVLIDSAADLYTGLFTHLYNIDRRALLHSYDSADSSIESLLYGALLGLVVNRVELVESTISTIQTRTKSTYLESSPTLIATSSGGVVRNSQGARYHTKGARSRASQLASDYISLLPLYPSPRESFSRNGALLVQLMTHSLSKYFRESDYSIGFSTLVDKYLRTTTEAQVINRYITSSSFLSYGLKGSFLEHPIFKTSSYYDLEVVLFHRSRLFNKLRSLLPIDFTWFSEEAKSPSGNVGKLLITFSRILSNWYVGYRRFSDGIRVSTSSPYYLERWGTELGLTRRIGELPEVYRARLVERTNLQGITLDNIKGALPGSSIEIRNPLITNTYLLSDHERNLGVGFLQGDLVNPSVVTLSHSPLGREEIELIKSIKPIGTRILYRQTIDLEACPNENQSYTELDSVVSNIQVSQICCSVYRPNEAYIVRVSISSPQDRALYISAKYENELILEAGILHTTRVVGVLKPGETSKLILIPPYFL